MASWAQKTAIKIREIKDFLMECMEEAVSDSYRKDKSSIKTKDGQEFMKGIEDIINGTGKNQR